MTVPSCCTPFQGTPFQGFGWRFFGVSWFFDRKSEQRESDCKFAIVGAAAGPCRSGCRLGQPAAGSTPQTSTGTSVRHCLCPVIPLHSQLRPCLCLRSSGAAGFEENALLELHGGVTGSAGWFCPSCACAANPLPPAAAVAGAHHGRTHPPVC